MKPKFPHHSNELAIQASRTFLRVSLYLTPNPLQYHPFYVCLLELIPNSGVPWEKRLLSFSEFYVDTGGYKETFLL
jgi:hypothetical protein